MKSILLATVMMFAASAFAQEGAPAPAPAPSSAAPAAPAPAKKAGHKKGKKAKKDAAEPGM